MKNLDFYLLEGDKELTEHQVQKHAVTFYRSIIKPIYPNSRLLVNPFTHMKFKPCQVNKFKSLGYEPKQPDLLFIQKIGSSPGLAIEIKKYTEVLKKQNGELVSDHLKAQDGFLQDLQEAGFKSMFCLGLASCCWEILNYFFTEEQQEKLFKNE